MVHRSLTILSVAAVCLVVTPEALYGQVWRVPLRDIHLDRHGPNDIIAAESVEFLPDGKTLATAGYVYSGKTGSTTAEVRLYHPDDASVQAILPGTARKYAIGSGCLAISSSGKLLAAAGTVKSHEAVVDLFEPVERELVRTLKGDPQTIFWLAFSPDEKTLAVARAFGPLELWDLESGKIKSVLEGVSRAVFSPDGVMLATDSDDEKVAIKFWSIDTAKPKEIGRIPALDMLPWAIAFSPDGKLVAAGGTGAEDSPVYVWQLARPERKGDPITAIRTVRLPGHREVTLSVAFSRDGKWLVSANSDQTARLWSMDSMTETAVIPAHRDVVYDAAFSPDGKSLVTLGRDAMMLWELKSLLRGK